MKDSSKIVCFVNNRETKFSDNDKIGLVRAFHRFDVIENCFCRKFLFSIDNNDNKVCVSDRQLSKSLPYLLISKKEGVILQSECPKWEGDWDMIWIHDSKKVSDVTLTEHNRSGFLNPEQTLVLFHKHPSWKEQETGKSRSDTEVDADFLSSNGFKMVKEGRHEPSEDTGFYYPLLYKIAKIWEDDDTDNGKFDSDEFDKVFKDIKDKIFPEKLDAALEFLHKCLVKVPETADYEKLTNVGITIPDNFSEKLTGTPMTPEYDTSLAELRDELLELVREK